MFDFSAESGFLALFVVSFMAATVLPGGSEFMLVAVIHAHPDAFWQAIGTATLGNTLGSMTSYGIGRLLPNRVRHPAIVTLQRYGYWALLLSWLPLIGDALAVGAGWLRLNPWLATAAFAIGKLFRYVMVGVGWTWFEALFLH